MKKILSIVLTIAMLLSVSAVAVSAQTTADVQPAQNVKASVKLLKSAVEALVDEDDDAYVDDTYLDFESMTREEFIAFFMPEGASDNLADFVNLLFGMLYDELIGVEYPDNVEYPDFDYDDPDFYEPEFETVDEYLQYIVDAMQEELDAFNVIDSAFLKLTDDDLQLLADKLNEIVNEFIEYDPDLETPDYPDFDDPDYDNPDDPDFGFDFSELTFTVEAFRMAHEIILEEIDNVKKAIEMVEGFIGSETFVDDVKAVIRICALLNASQDECTRNYYDSAWDRFYEEYPDADFGWTFYLDELEDLTDVDYVYYFFNGLGDDSFVLYLYADADNLSDTQTEYLTEVRELLSGLHSNVIDYIAFCAGEDVLTELANDLDIYLNTEFKYGDADNNGKINIFDVLTIQKHLAGQKVKIDLEAADVTHDGKVNIFDTLKLCKHLAGQHVDLNTK